MRQNARRKSDPYNLARYFEYLSKEAYKRNGHVCVCEKHNQRVKVLTKKMGAKVVSMAQHGTVHLSTCQHSELARTTWASARTTPDNPNPKRQRMVVENA